MRQYIFFVFLLMQSALFAQHPVFEHARENRIDSVKAFINSGGDVNIINPKNNSNLIHYSSINGYYRLTEYLINSGADINRNAANGTPLRLAASQSSFPVCELLINSGARTDIKDAKGRSAMDYANKNPLGKLLKYPDSFRNKLSYKEIIKIMKAYQKQQVPDVLLLYAELLVEQAEKEKGKKHWHYADAKSYLPALYEQNGLYDKALQAQKEYSKIAKSFFGSLSTKYLFSEAKTADYLIKSGDTIAASEHLAALQTRMEKAKKQNYRSYYYTRLLRGKLFYGKKQYKKAKKHLEYLKKELPGKQEKAYSLYYEEALRLLISIYKNNEDMKQAEEASILFTEYKAGSQNKFEYVKALTSLADLYADAENPEKAIIYYKKAKTLIADNSSKRNYYYIYNNIGYAKNNAKTGYYKEAETAANENIKLLSGYERKLPSQYILSVRALVQVKKLRGQYEEALHLMEKVSNFTKEIKGDTSAWYAADLTLTGDLNRLSGNYEQAFLNYNNSLKIYKQTYGENDPNYKSVLIALAMIHTELGNYKEADEIYNHVIEFRKKHFGEDNFAYAGLLGIAANMYIKTGDFEKAARYTQKAMEVKENSFGKLHVEYAISLNNLAVIYMEMDKKEQAEELLIEAMEIYKNLFGEMHREYANSMFNLGLYYYLEKDYKKARKLVSNSLDIFAQTLGTEHHIYASCLAAFASIYAQSGRKRKAFKLFDEALLILEKTLGTEHPEYILTLSNKARALSQAGKSDKAETAFKRLNPLLYKRIDYTTKFMSEKEREMFINEKASDFFEVFFSFALERKEKNPAITEICFNNALKFKGLLLNSSLALRRTIMTSTDTSLIKLYTKYTDTGKLLARQYSRPKNERTFDTDSLESVLNSYEKELAKRTTLYRENNKQNSIDYSDIKKSLKKDELVLEFIRFRKKNKKTDSLEYIYAVLILHKDYKHPLMKRLFSEHSLEKLLKRPAGLSEYEYIKSLYQTGQAKSDSLYQFLWKPLEPELNGIRKIYISPTGLLNRISFDAIPLNDSTIISDKHHILYASGSSKIIDMPQIKSSDLKSAVLFGGVHYDISPEVMVSFSENEDTSSHLPKMRSLAPEDSLTRGVSWSYLPGSLEEAKSIHRTFAEKNIESLLLKGKSGSEEAFKSLSDNAPSVLHVSTHGFYFPNKSNADGIKHTEAMLSDKIRYAHSDNPLIRSGLVLAGGQNAFNGYHIPEGVEDGVLSAYEVSRMNLFGNKLAVLSACQTGLGDVKGSEGVYGLQRSFKMAGSEYLIFSLWEVPDKTTRELMSAFYKNWLSGADIHQAFKMAQNKLKQKYKNVPGSAFAWAAFVLMY